jgi:hypothetical protein
MEKWLQLTALVLLPLFLIQCGSSEIITSQNIIQQDQVEYQYSDSTIAEYFEMMPQISVPIKISVFDAGPNPWHMAGDLETLEDVMHVNYITPGLLRITGTIRESPFGYSNRYSTESVDLLQLRSLAAQSHSDLILYVQPTHEIKSGANALALIYVGLIPMFFVPGNSVEVESSVDVYLIDVRNGFIYTSFRNRTSAEKRFVKINFNKHADELIADNSERLMESVVRELERSFGNEFFLANKD